MPVWVMSPDSLCRWQVQISLYCTRRIPVFNPVAPYRYILPTVYLFMPDIENQDLFVCCCRTWICLDITRLYEEKSSSGSEWLAFSKNCKSGPLFLGQEVSTQFAQQLAKTGLTVPPLVCRLKPNKHHKCIY